MDLSTRLSKKTEIPPLRIFGTLIQIICRLLQFHIKRLFKLDTFEPLVRNKYDSAEWTENPDEWFSILLSAIMPGTCVIAYTFDEPIRIASIYTKSFRPFIGGNVLQYLKRSKDGKWKCFTKMSFEEVAAVPVYVTPASAFGQTLAPDTIIISTVRLENSGPACKKILAHLLKGVVLAFDLSRNELDVIVKSTKDIPSVEESREIFKNLFKTPIDTQVMVPKDFQSTLQQNSVPKMSCHHPTKVPFDSPELYERMLTLIIANGVLLIFLICLKPVLATSRFFWATG